MTTDTREIKLNAPPLPDYKEGEYAGPAGEGIGENLWDFDSMVNYAASSYRKGQRDFIEAMDGRIIYTKLIDDGKPVFIFPESMRK